MFGDYIHGDIPASTETKLYYILVKNRWKSSVKDMKTYFSMDYSSNHNDLVAEIRLKLRRNVIVNSKPLLWNPNSTKQFEFNVSRSLKDITI